MNVSKQRFEAKDVDIVVIFSGLVGDDFDDVVSVDVIAFGVVLVVGGVVVFVVGVVVSFVFVGGVVVSVVVVVVGVVGGGVLSVVFE